ncbi:DsbE family thiol:disulfide interchange protein [Litorimonas sp. RW-G-Af-16]|uniref:DsbE family thiol:disulfide interchange protein n=1 Tax=Litorimonas sp. RW-G-Af-16 TaxID=3241168 RepID=UPI00390CCA7C
MKRFAPLILFVLLGIAFAFALTRDPRKLDSVIIDQPFPDFSLSELYDPDAVLTESLLQGQVSVINVFGSWCVACSVEHPILMDIAREDRVNMIGINWRDERAKGQAWLAERGDPYNIIIFDPESVLAIPLGVVGAPETFITDASGRIRYKHIGPIDRVDWENTFKPLIAKLEAEG